jgi:hypothetical protein
MSADIPRRSIQELEARYQLEPTIRDIFVEGDFDIDVITWFKSEIDVDDIVVYGIDTVDTSDIDLGEEEDGGGNRRRVILLARHFENHLNLRNRIAFIADMDEGRLFRRIPSVDGLLFTDYACMESYAYTEQNVWKFMTFIVPSQIGRHHCVQLKRCLDSILLKAFVIRGWAKQNGLRHRDVGLAAFCSTGGGAISFDSSSMVSAILRKNGSTLDIDEVLIALDDIVSQCSVDPRHQVDGHDLGNLLSYLIRSVFSVHLRENILLRQLFAQMEIGVILAYPLFLALKERFSEQIGGRFVCS